MQLLIALFLCQCVVTPTAVTAVRPNGVFVDDVIISGGSLPIPELNCSSSDLSSCFMVISEFEVEFVPIHCGFGMPLMRSSSDSVQVVRLAAASPPVQGTFNLSLNGVTTSDIAVDISADELLEEMERAFPDEGGFEVSRTGDCYGYQWEVRWPNKGGDQPSMEVSGILSGHSPTIQVVTITDGGVWLRPLRGDMLRLPERQPQVK